MLEPTDDALTGGTTSTAGARLNVGSVARRLGVAPATLRTWARRYDLGPTEHRAGSHRLYSAADVARLQEMRRLTLLGVTPGEAARVAASALHTATRPLAAVGSRALGSRALTSRSVTWISGDVGDDLDDAAAQGLARAALTLDSRSATELLRAQVAARGVVRTWDLVLRPVLVAAGAYWAATWDGIEVEHMLADCAMTVFRAVAESAGPEPERPVLLACAPGERHALPLYAVAAGLAEAGTSCRVLGPALPAPALEAAVRRTDPSVLFVWSQSYGTADASMLDALPSTRPSPAVLVGGPGWRPAQLPRHITKANDLPHALHLVSQALSG